MKFRFLIVASLAFLLVALPAAAEVYTVTLTNGTEFETRAHPTIAGWDDEVVLLLTDVGNWIGIAKSDIVSVIADTERDGFGKVIDVHTVALGWAPNDAPVEDPDAALDPTTRLLNFLAAEQSNRQDFSVQQFAEPGDAGQGGLPVGGYRGLGDTAFATRGGGAASDQPQVIDQ